MVGIELTRVEWSFIGASFLGLGEAKESNKGVS
jgi:hypothetical protein